MGLLLVSQAYVGMLDLTPFDDSYDLSGYPRCG